MQAPQDLTAALELLRRTDIVPVILEASEEIGGISRTIRYKGNRMDIGGHRFFSKSDRVMQWWMDLMPPDLSVPGQPATLDQTAASKAHGEPLEISYQGKRRVVAVPAHLPEEPPLRGMGPLHADEDDRPGAARDLGRDVRSRAARQREPGACPSPRNPDLVMLIRPRRAASTTCAASSTTPSPSRQTPSATSASRAWCAWASATSGRACDQIKPEKSLEDFLINRFGRELYLTFFKSYTEKVWGTPCDEISAEWGAQRIKGLSLTTAVKHFLSRSSSRVRRRAPQ